MLGFAPLASGPLADDVTAGAAGINLAVPAAVIALAAVAPALVVGATVSTPAAGLSLAALAPTLTLDVIVNAACRCLRHLGICPGPNCRRDRQRPCRGSGPIRRGSDAARCRGRQRPGGCPSCLRHRSRRIRWRAYPRPSQRYCFCGAHTGPVYRQNNGGAICRPEPICLAPIFGSASAARHVRVAVNSTNAAAIASTANAAVIASAANAAAVSNTQNGAS
jgi:hypothetical protein